MEDLGNIKSFRNNLLLISIINLLIIIFSENIKEINLLGLIKITDINSIKLLIILLIVNLYAFRRYHQYVIKMDKNFNYTLLLREILNSKNYISIRNYRNQDTNLTISKNGNIQNDGNNIIFRNIFSNKDIICDLIKNYDDNNEIIKLHTNGNLGDDYTIIYTNNLKNKYLKFLFFLNERFYFDYYLPIWIGNISLILLTIKVIYESNNIL